MAGLLNETLRRWARTDCDPLPCGLEVWRYCCEAAAVPVEPLPYHQDNESAAALLKANGGLVSYAGSLIEPLGWRPIPIDEIRRGDVGVVTIPAMGKTCALFAGRLWAVKGDRNVLLVNATPLKAWRLECLKP